jgi:hypothetical protein
LTRTLSKDLIDDRFECTCIIRLLESELLTPLTGSPSLEYELLDDDLAIGRGDLISVHHFYHIADLSGSSLHMREIDPLMVRFEYREEYRRDIGARLARITRSRDELLIEVTRETICREDTRIIFTELVFAHIAKSTVHREVSDTSLIDE